MKENELARSIGKRIRQLREQHGVTQFELSEIIDISPSYMGLIERGQRQLTIKRMLVLCDFFRVTTDYVILGKSENQTGSKENLIPCLFNEAELELIDVLCKILIIRRFSKAELEFIREMINLCVKLIAERKC